MRAVPIRLFAGCFLSLLCAAGALAQPLLKPGLWEITSQTTIDGKPMPNMQDMFKNMPPEQRKQMQAMMAKQGVGMGAGGSNAVRVCMTPEHARQALTQPQGVQNCKQQAVQQIANTMKYSFVCDNPKAQGEGAASWNSDNTQFTNKVKIRSERSGKMFDSEIDGAGKWLGADCGAVKPLPLPVQGK